MQILFENLSKEEQQKMADFVSENSNLLQERIFLNLIKLPILVRIIPICSEIKFDLKKNPNFIREISEIESDEKNVGNKVFLYNPWEKMEGVNYYWTVNSHQRIYVEFQNPLSIEIEVKKITIIFEGKKPFTFPGNFSFKIVSTYIPPLSSSCVYCKIRPNEIGETNIIGVKYEIYNTIGVQFVDDNGNGIYFNYNNTYKDLTNFSKVFIF